MGKVKELLLENRFEVGTKVIPYVHRSCMYCKTWMRFRYDEACREIITNGYYKLICPECEHEYTYESEMYLPDTYMKFIEVE